MMEPKILAELEIQERLKKLPAGWQYQNNKIAKSFVFDSILQGIQMLNVLIPFCDEIDHHPDIHIYYKKFVFELSRFSVGGKVTDRDFIVAGKIEELFREK